MNKNISYPEQANNIYAEIEPNSYWFNHRNKVIHQILNKYKQSGSFWDVGGGNGFVSMYLQEKELALIGRQTANELFRAADKIEFKDLKWDKYGGRVLSNVYLDGKPYSDILIEKGLARSYDGGAKKGWGDE